jgi:hypothetical protein
MRRCRNLRLPRMAKAPILIRLRTGKGLMKPVDPAASDQTRSAAVLRPRSRLLRRPKWRKPGENLLSLRPKKSIEDAPGAAALGVCWPCSSRSPFFWH